MISMIMVYLAIAFAIPGLPCLQEGEADQSFLDYKIDEFVLEGKTIFRLENLVGMYGLKKGDPYSPKLIKEKLEVIQRVFLNYGYIDFTYTPRINVNHEEKTVSCAFLLLPGKQYFVKQINILGIRDKNDDKEIRSVLNEYFVNEGKLFNSIAFEMCSRKLERLLESKNLTLKECKYERSSDQGTVDISIRIQTKGR
jgi:outer membrane protein assembly factor BamA